MAKVIGIPRRSRYAWLVILVWLPSVQADEPAPIDEQNALRFVRRHHAELADLLTRLETMRPNEYREAIAEIDAARRLIVKTRKRDPRKAELELACWKTRSRCQLAAARAQRSSDPEDEAEFRRLLGELHAARARKLDLQQSRLENRLRRVRESSARWEEQRESWIDERVRRMTSPETTQGD